MMEGTWTGMVRVRVRVSSNVNPHSLVLETGRGECNYQPINNLQRVQKTSGDSGLVKMLAQLRWVEMLTMLKAPE